jgi:serine protease Do
MHLMIVAAVLAGWEGLRVDIFKAINELSGSELIADSNDVDLSDQVRNNQKSKKEDSKLKQDKNSKHNIHVSFEKGFEDLATAAKDSVVSVATMQLMPDDQDIFGNSPFSEMFKDFFDTPLHKPKPKRTNALGSGFVVQTDKDIAYIVTNNHVVEHAKKIVVYTSDRIELPAVVHAVDKRTDIAVLAVGMKNRDSIKLKPIEWGNSDNANVGNWVVAIGNPFGFGNTVTVGIISAKSRNLASSSTSLGEDFIQHSAQINMGNSGGCLLDVYGKVIGINTAIYTPSGGNVGIGFAIPSNLAKFTVDQLIEFKRTFRGWLGAEVHSVKAKQAESVGLIPKGTLGSSKIYGAFVAKLVPNSPAEKAGLKVSDIILEFNGEEVSEDHNLPTLVGRTKIGSKVNMKVWRLENNKWRAKTLTVEVGDYEKAMESGTLDSAEEGTNSGGKKREETLDALGITITTIPEAQSSQYPKDAKVMVSKVDEKDTSFFGPLFEPGDGIISVNNQPITSVSQMKKIINEIKKDKTLKGAQIPFVISRGKSLMFVATTIDFAPEDTK